VIGVGAGVADFLRYNNQVECVGVNVATAATIEEYSLLRDQLWFGLQKWLKDGGAIPTDPKLEAELVAPTYAFDLRGRIKVEPKEKIKERLRRSPDRADALALAVGPLLPGGELRISWLW
jgi:phage terminase large subunit